MSKTIDLKAFNPYKVEGLKRIGNGNDGGYVVHFPSLQQTDCLVNYGVGYDVSFEKQYNKITGNPVYAFDPTMKKKAFFIEKIKTGKYVETLKQSVNLLFWTLQEKELKKYNIHFIEEGLAAENTQHFKTFGYHLSKYHLSEKKVFLKIDIEGVEFEIFNNKLYHDLKNVIQFVMEFHYAGKNLEKIAEIMDRLSTTHSLIHIHGNNIGPTFPYNGQQIPEVFEVTFLHNSFLPEKTFSALDYPVKGLDFPCNKKREDLKLDFFK